MSLLQIKALKQKAASILSDSNWNYPRIVCIHAAVSVGAALLLMLIDLLLASVSVESAGLSGIGFWAVLETGRSLLSMGLSLVLPFWQIGILYTSVRMSRGQEPAVSQLTRGFSRFGPVLRYYLLMVILVIVLSTVSSYASLPFMLGVSMPSELEQLFLSIDEAALEDPQQLLDAAAAQQLLPYLLRLMIPAMAVLGLAVIYLSYRFRLCPYLLLDEPGMGAIQAVLSSGRLTKGYKWSLFKLDLSFWWYFLLHGLVNLIALLPAIMEYAGAVVPVPYPVLCLICQSISSMGSLLLIWRAGAYVELTYACAYDQLITPLPQI